MTDNPLTRYMQQHRLSSSQLAALIKADGIKGIGAVTIRQWMCEGHKPYRTAIDKLRAFPHWHDLADRLEWMADGGKK